jgi:putative restriction endonuclease
VPPSLLRGVFSRGTRLPLRELWTTLRGYVAVTDPIWLRRLLSIDAHEANFWQPRPAPLRQDFGTPWIFKVRGSDRVAGYGLYSYYTVMPVGIAWETFGAANGVASYAEMLNRIVSLRRGPTASDSVGCAVLSNLVVLAEDGYIRGPSDWMRNTVRGQYYDLAQGEGARIWAHLMAATPIQPAASPLLDVPGGVGAPALYQPRRGQGAFRLMVMDAYERRCAITGEKTLPALDAAHIRPFRDVESHEVENGILLRSDVHRLFDQGYVTVTPDYRFRVSSRIRDEFHNGLIYYDLHERPIRLPTAVAQQPDTSALEWHSSQIYRE